MTVWVLTQVCEVDDYSPAQTEVLGVYSTAARASDSGLAALKAMFADVEPELVTEPHFALRVGAFSWVIEPFELNA